MKHTQQGLSLLTVLVVLLLTLVTVLGTVRTALFHEILQGSQSDYQRSFAAAEALLRDAERDIQPPRETACLVVSGAIVIGCRISSTTSPWFPRSNTQFEEVRDIVHEESGGNNSDTPCLQGICFPRNSTLLANPAQNLDAMRPLGACYGQFTRRLARQQGQVANEVNPILQARFDSDNRCTQAQAWYWVEVFRYANVARGNDPAFIAALRPDPSARVVYRITALAQGLKPGTQVVLQSIFVPFPARQTPSS